MFKVTIPSLLNRSRALMSKAFGSETQRILSAMLYDDDVNVLTTFDMNRVASYTFGETICGEIFDLLEHTVRNPQEFTVLSLHKVLVLLHHLAIYACQKAANSVWILKPHIKPLMEYNTVLMAHADPKSLMSKIQRIKGGSVDRGMPVRDAAKALYDLVSDVELFRTVRSKSADPDALVPVGNREEIGFVSDELRKHMLEQKLKEKERSNVAIKSNLHGNGAGGFGSGANTNLGKNVVGAAHSIEEMLKVAMKNSTPGYRDGALSEEEQAHFNQVKNLQDEFQMKKAMGLEEDGSANANANVTSSTSGNGIVDLLDFGNDNIGNTSNEFSDVISPSKSVESLPYDFKKEDPFLPIEKDDISDDEEERNYNGNVLNNFGSSGGGIFGTGGAPVTATPMTSNGNSNLNPNVMSSMPKPTQQTNDLLSMTMGMGGMTMNEGGSGGNHNSNSAIAMAVGNNNLSSSNSPFGSIPANSTTAQIGFNVMGGSASASASVPNDDPFSAFNALEAPSNMNSNVMGGGASSNFNGSNGNIMGAVIESTNHNLMGGAPAHQVAVSSMSMSDNIRPSTPSDVPPMPPSPPAHAPNELPSQAPYEMNIMGSASPVVGSGPNSMSQLNNNMPSAMGGSGNVSMNLNAGMNNSSHSTNAMHMQMPMMNNSNQMMNSSNQMMNNSNQMMNMNMNNNNPQIMMNAVQTMSPENQQQFLQQMIMMNQQLMQQNNAQNQQQQQQHSMMNGNAQSPQSSYPADSNPFSS